MTNAKPLILLVDDDESVLFGYKHSLSREGYQVQTALSLEDAKKRTLSGEIDAVVLDLQLPDGNALEWIPELKQAWPDLPVIVATGKGDVPTAVTAMKFGAENFLIKPVETENLETVIKKVLEIGGLRKMDRIHRRLQHSNEPFFGDSPAIMAVKRQIDVAIANDTVLLIQGETGTGKGVLAKWIHESGIRKKEAFVELNCSCLKGDLLRSELFGHARGAFTSSVSDREGLVEIADKGTLFLDEIGDMDLDVQTQFLKTIEERTFRRVGENRTRKSDFRLICATNKDLAVEMEKGLFRKDLFYRICVFPIMLPPLRERQDDIPSLALHLLTVFGIQEKPLSPEIIDLIKKYAWPGNIRELRNVLERANLLAQGGPLRPECFPGLNPQAAQPTALPPGDLREIESDYLKKLLDSCNGDKKKVCEIMGISLATLYRKLGNTKS
jgi:DNA-binding NtrC family response regulator